MNHIAMGNKIDEAKLIDYLYGELPEDEKRDVKKYLSRKKSPQSGSRISDTTGKRS